MIRKKPHNSVAVGWDVDGVFLEGVHQIERPASWFGAVPGVVVVPASMALVVSNDIEVMAVLFDVFRLVIIRLDLRGLCALR